MNKLESLKNMGFKISWKLIGIGIYGYDEIPILLTRDDILDYLNSMLTSINEQTDSIISLVCEENDPVEFDRILRKLVNDDSSNTTIQKRKWRAYLLRDLLDHISKDSLQGLLELMEFWISMGTTDNCPQTFPESNNSESIQEYFTKSSYDFLVDRNNAWLNEEILSIIKLDS